MTTTTTRTGASRLTGRARAAYMALRARRGWALPDVVDVWQHDDGRLAYAVRQHQRPAADRYRVVCDEHGATTTAPTRPACVAVAAAASLWCPGCAHPTPTPRSAVSSPAGWRRGALAGMTAGPGDRGRDGRRLSDRPARRRR